MSPWADGRGSPGGEPVTAYQGRGASPRRRRRRWLTPLWVSTLGLGLTLLVADRVAASVVTQHLQDQIVAGLAAHEIAFDSVTVTIAGYPFLNQVAQGRYDQITIDMVKVRSATAQDGEVALPHLQVVATGVSADAVPLMRGTAVVTADRLAGTAVVSFPTVALLLGDALVGGGVVGGGVLGVSNPRFFDVDGTLHATGTATVNGVPVDVTAAIELTASGDTLEIGLREARVADLTPPAVVSQFLASLQAHTFRARLPTLPFALALDQVRSQPTGLAISASARAVPLSG